MRNKEWKVYFHRAKGNPIFRDVDGTPASSTLIFDSFTNGGLELSFERGYTWGSLTVLNNQRHSAQLSSSGRIFSTNRRYADSPLSYRANCQDGIQVSTDFQFIPVESSIAVVEDPVLTALPDVKKAEKDGITWYAFESGEGSNEVDVVYAAGNFNVGENGRVELQIPESLVINGVNKRVAGIVARTIDTGSRYDRQYTYSLGSALADYHFDLTIPATVKKIKELALANNNNLHTVTLAEGIQLTEIAANAFANSKNMRFANVLLNVNSLTSIGNNAFAGTRVEALALACNISALRNECFKGMERLGFLDLRKVTGTNTRTKIHRGMEALKGLSPHTLVCVKKDAYAPQVIEENVVVFDNNAQGVCNHLALYDYKADETTQEVKTYGISVPAAGTHSGVDEAAFKAVKATFNRTFSVGYSTLCLPYTAQMPTGMKAYTFAEERRADGSTQYVFAQVAGTTLNAKTPYVVDCSQAGVTLPESREVVVSGVDRYTVGNTLNTSASGPLFVGTFSTLQHDEAIALRGIYSLNTLSQQWMRIYDENGDINTRAIVVPYRTFFLNADGGAGLAKAIRFVTDDTTTSIASGIAEQEQKAPTAIYSIDGRRMTQNFDELPKGIYIVNGKKVVK